MEDELAAAQEYVEALPLGRLRDALHHLQRSTAMEVSLSNLALTVRQLEVACVLLKHNFICERLLVTGNDLPPEAGYFLAEMLKANRAVKHLVLLGNMIGDVGVGLIADALTVNTTLLTLDLSRNFIRREGAICLSRALLVNTTLTDLYLTGNWIQPEGRRALYKVLGAAFHLPPMMRFTSTTTRGHLKVLKI